MKKKSVAFLTGLFLVAGVSSEAALLAYEGFDYPTGGLEGKGGGTGWTGPWEGGSGYAVVSNSLSMPNLPFATTGGSVVGTANADRGFSAVDLSTDAVYFVSFIIQRTGWDADVNSGEWFDFHFRDAGKQDILSGGISSTEKFETRILPSGNRLGASATNTSPYFVVLKVVARATEDDEIYLNAYSTNGTIEAVEPASWMIEGWKTNNNSVAGFATLWAGTGSGYQAAVDEIRVGETWEDVVPVEEVSDLIAYEGFEYPVGYLDKQGEAIDGWTGYWRSGEKYTVVADSLSMPNLPFVPKGGSIVGQDTANRNFTGIDLDKDAVYYASFIMQRTGWGADDNGGEWFDFHFRTQGYVDAALAGISSREQFEARISTAGVANGGDAGTTEPYFIVTKVVAHAGSTPDEIYLKAYSGSDAINLSEVLDWTVVGGSTNTDLLANMVTLWAGTDNDADGLYQAAIDEIRIGRTWEAVVPSTIPLQAEIVGIKSVSGNLLEMVVNAPTPVYSQLYGKDNLVFGSWTNMAQSIDGNDPFIITNMEYSIASELGRVIYVKADDATLFFKVDTEK